MTDDGAIQEMIGKGVSKDMRIFPERFQTCTCCGVIYDQYNRALLNCGHFMCNQCYSQTKRCTYPNCSNTSPSIKPFNMNKKQKVSQDSTFRFAISCVGNRREIQKQAKGKTTFGELIYGDSFIEDYINHYGSSKINVVLGSKQVKWLDIKGKQIYDLYVHGKCNLLSASNANNPLRFKQRYNGGMKK